VANERAADAGGRDPQALLRQFIGDPRVSPGRLFQDELEDAPLDGLGDPVLRVRYRRDISISAASPPFSYSSLNR
jgi:hypothetical protein